MRMRATLGPLSANPTCAVLLAQTGRPAEAPFQLARMPVRPCAEGLVGSRQLAEGDPRDPDLPAGVAPAVLRPPRAGPCGRRAPGERTAHAQPLRNRSRREGGLASDILTKGVVLGYG